MDTEHDEKEGGLNTRLQIYLREPDNLMYEIEMRLDLVAKEFGVTDIYVLDTASLRRVVDNFQENCVQYWAELGVAAPSHLKIFGHLLYCMTQARDTGGRRIDFSFCNDKDVSELADREAKHIKYLSDYFHEFSCFVVVNQMLLSAQLQREERLKYDTRRPPSSRRFTRSMVDYLREWPEGSLSYDKTPFDLYMIFKAMDLYGVESGK